MGYSYNPGPENSSIEGITEGGTLTLPVLDFKKDFRVLESGPGLWKVTDLTSPKTQPSTIRIAQTVRANIYAGTQIDPSMFLANKEGVDTIIELREVGLVSNEADPLESKQVPFRLAITWTDPMTDGFTYSQFERAVLRALAFAYDQQVTDETREVSGISALQHRVLAKF